ncbi:MAG TPA: glycosyltransferase, partial [Acidimicrobiales bacterium]|nr:glycosyltransferase [Acidimicrobiales bacterium]
VASVGGGVDGARLLRTVLSAAACRGWRGAAFTGPDMPPEERAALVAAARGTAMRVSEFEPMFGDVLGRADVAVTMGGANTVGDILEAGCRSVLVPRTEPRQEQVVRARIMAERGRATVVLPSDLSVERLIDAVDRTLTLPQPEPLRLEGASRAADVLLGAVTGAAPARAALAEAAM